MQPANGDVNLFPTDLRVDLPSVKPVRSNVTFAKSHALQELDSCEREFSTVNKISYDFTFLHFFLRLVVNYGSNFV